MSHDKLIEYGKNFDAFMAQAKKFNVISAVVPGREGEWSATYVMHHVADAEMHFMVRYFNALTIDKPHIIQFDEDVYPSVLNYEGRDWLNSLALIESIGKQVQVALSGLSKEQWERVSIHPQAGEVSISTLLAKASNHLLAHTGQLKEAS
jgi:hypothetical protein